MTHFSMLYRIFLLKYYIFGVVYSNCQSCGKDRNSTGQKHFFYLLTLLPYYDSDPYMNPSWNEGDNIQPALNLAADQINKRPDILGNYSMYLVHQRDGCDEPRTSITLASFTGEAYRASRQDLAGVIGPACSSSTSALGSLTKKPGLLAVTVHDAGSPKFANRSAYPFHLGVLGSTESYVEGLLYLIREANWTKVAVLYDPTRQFHVNAKIYFAQKAKNIELHLLTVQDMNIPLQEIIQQKRYRVIILMAPVSLARKVLCLAYNLSMTRNRYQFLITSARPEDFSNSSKSVEFYHGNTFYECSSRSIWENVLNGSFLIQYNLLPKLRKRLVSNMTYMEYRKAYVEYRNMYTLETGRKSRYSYWATNLYDAVWAWALVLDNLTKENENFKINYGDRDTSDRIVQQFYQLHFEGMSGPIAFDNSTGFVKREVMIFQVNESNTSCVAAVVGTDGGIRRGEYEPCASPHFIPDSFNFEIVRESWGLALFFFLLTLSELFIVITLHISTLAYKNEPSVKAASLKLLNISYAGVYFLISGTLSWTLFSAVSINIELKHYFCQLLWGWTIPLGISLSFGPVVMKTWRLYRIFEHYLNPGPFISTPYLMAGTGFVAFLNLGVSTAWTASDSYWMNATYYFTDNNEILPSDVIQCKVQWRCTCHYQIYWLLFIAALQIGILLVGTVLALLTRNIKNASFTTSSLQVLVYLMSIVIVLGASLFGISQLSVVQKQDRKSYFSFSVICILLNTVISLFIGWVFFPPLVPQAKKSRAKLRRMGPSQTSASKLIPSIHHIVPVS